MLVIDLSQTLCASILSYDVKNPDKIETDLFRHICLNIIRNIMNKFKYEYGPKIVIACDSKNNWRKELFEYYKYNRRKSRKDSDIDWSKIYEKFDLIKSELKETFTQYKVIEIDRAEADDIIACCAKLCYNNNEKIMIISSDKDLVQLQKYNNVKQYDAIHKKSKETDDPIKFLEYQVFKGDSSDGVPNVLSPSNTYFTGMRSKPLYEKKIIEWLNDPAFNFNPKQVLGEEIFQRYDLNKKLIDLSCIPQYIIDNINEELNKPYDVRDSNKLLNYFCQHNLGNLIQWIQDF